MGPRDGMGLIADANLLPDDGPSGIEPTMPGLGSWLESSPKIAA